MLRFDITRQRGNWRTRRILIDLGWCTQDLANAIEAGECFGNLSTNGRNLHHRGHHNTRKQQVTQKIPD